MTLPWPATADRLAHVLGRSRAERPFVFRILQNNNNNLHIIDEIPEKPIGKP